MLYSTLSQRNEEYYPDTWAELSLLYEGGYELLGHAQRFLPKLVNERPERYAERVRLASYVNHLAEIIDYFVANLFNQEIAVVPAADATKKTTPGDAPVEGDFYTAFAHDCDLQGTSFSKMLRDLASCTLLKRRTVVAVDLPAAMGNKPAMMSRADEDKIGAARAYCYEVPVEQLIDWKKDDRGNYAWAIIHRELCERASPSSTRSTTFEEFKVWQQDPETGVVGWDMYRVERKGDQKVDPNLDLQPVGGSATSFPWVPLVEICLPSGLWVGNKVGCLAREHFQTRSALNAAMRRSLFAIPWVKQGPEIPEVGGAMSEAQQNPQRGRDPVGQFNRNGFMVLGHQDDIGFAEPEGKAYSLTREDLKDLVDEMFHVSHQMAASVSNTTKSLGRSGQSKAQDKAATEVVLTAFGHKFRDFAKRIYDTVAGARKDKVVWTPHGLDKYELLDRETLLEEATSMDTVDVPSATFRKLYKTKVAMALLGDIPPDTKETIRKEIEDGVDEAEAAAKIAAESPDQNDPNADNQVPPPAVPPVKTAGVAPPAKPKAKVPAKPLVGQKKK